MSHDDFRLSEGFMRGVMRSASIRHPGNDLVLHYLTGKIAQTEHQTSEKRVSSMGF